MLRVSLPETHFEEVTMGDGESYTAVSVAGAGFSRESQPALPIFGNWLLIPNGTKVNLEVDPGGARDLTP